MDDLREQYLRACRAYATHPTEANHRRMLELAREQKAAERVQQSSLDVDAPTRYGPFEGAAVPPARDPNHDETDQRQTGRATC